MLERFDLKKLKGKRRKKYKNISLVRLSDDDLVPSSIKNFDVLSGGGFKKKTINVLVGGPGSGKTIFATQFLFNGLKEGERCLYLTFEEEKSQFYKNMLEFGWDLAKYEKEGKFIFIRDNPLNLRRMLEEGGGTLEYHMIDKGVSRLVIDSITSYEALFNGESEKRKAYTSLFDFIKKWDCISILTVENNDVNKDLSAGPIDFASDSITRLYLLFHKTERKRFLEVIKKRGSDHSNKIHSFQIGQKGVDIKLNPFEVYLSLKRVNSG